MNIRLILRKWADPLNPPFYNTKHITITHDKIVLLAQSSNGKHREWINVPFDDNVLNIDITDKVTPLKD